MMEEARGERGEERIHKGVGRWEISRYRGGRRSSGDFDWWCRSRTIPMYVGIDFPPE